MKNFSFKQTQWLVSLLSASCVSVVSLLWKLAAVLLRWERSREGSGGRGGGSQPRSSMPASLHCPGGKHQPLDQQRDLWGFLPPRPSQTTPANIQGENGPFLRGRFGPPSKKNYINKSLFEWENEQRFSVFSPCDGLIFRELKWG